MRSILLVLASVACHRAAPDENPTLPSIALQYAQPRAADCPNPLTRYADADGDGHGDAEVAIPLCEEVIGYVDTNDDCDDLRDDISPSAVEVCEDGLDNNCDGVDADCGGPNLTTDAIRWTRSTSSDEFGATLVGNLTDSGGAPFAFVGAPSADSSSGTSDNGGAIFALRDTSGHSAGTTVPLSTDLAYTLRGAANLEVGSAMTGILPIGATTIDAVALGVGGVVNIGGLDYACAVLFVDAQAAADGDLPLAATGARTCETTASPGPLNGVEAIAAGNWTAAMGTVLAAGRPNLDRVWVDLSPDLHSFGVMGPGGPIVAGSVGANYGEALAWADLDGDDFDDLIVGVPSRSTVAMDAGGVDVFPAMDLFALPMGAETSADTIGFGLAFDTANQNAGVHVLTGDIDDDGLPEIVLTTFEEDATELAKVIILSPGTLTDWGSTRRTLDNLPPSASWTTIQTTEAMDLFGFSAAWIGDGLVVGAPGADPASDPSQLDGALYIFAPSADIFDSTHHTAADFAHAVLPSPLAGEALGLAIDNAGDIDGDGAAEVWVTSYGFGTPEASVVLLLETGL